MKKKNVLYLKKVWIKLLLVFVITQTSCGQNKNEPGTSNVSAPAVDSIIKPQKGYMDQRTHVYGDYTLTRYPGDNDFESILTEGKDSLKLIEHAPGFIIFQSFPFEQYLRIESYDTLTKKFNWRVDVEAISPYKKSKYKNLRRGGFSGGLEFNLPDPISDCDYGQLPKPDNYYVDWYVYPTQSNGFTVITYDLLKVHKENLVVGFEAAFTILDSHGRIVLEKTFPHKVLWPEVDPEGKFVACSFGLDDVNDPFAMCKSAGAVYSIRDGSTVYFEEVSWPERLGYPIFFKTGFNFEYFGKTKDWVRHQYIDLSTQTLYKYEFDYKRMPKNINKEYYKYFEYITSLPCVTESLNK